MGCPILDHFTDIEKNIHLINVGYLWQFDSNFIAGSYIYIVLCNNPSNGHLEAAIFLVSYDLFDVSIFYLLITKI